MPTFEINLKDGRAFHIDSEQEPSEDQVLEAINGYTAQGYQAAPQAEGMLATAGRELASGALPALGTVGGAIVGAAGGSTAGPAGTIAGDIAGGYLGGQVGQGIQQDLMGDLAFRRNQAQLQANRQANPHSAEIGAFAPMIASSLGGAGGLTAAGREAALVGESAPMLERIAQNAVSGARMDASASGQRANLGEDTNLLSDTAKGALAFGVTGFLPHAESIVQSLGKGVGDAALMTIANEMYDSVKEGRAPSAQNIYEKTGESIPSFLLMNGVMSAVGGHPFIKGKESKVETPAPFAAEELNTKMQETFNAVKAEEDAKVEQHAIHVNNQVQQANAVTEQVLANPDLPQEAKDALIQGQQKLPEVARAKVQQFALDKQTEAQKRFEELFPEQPVAEAPKEVVEPEVRQEPVVEPAPVETIPPVEELPIQPQIEPTIPNENQIQSTSRPALEQELPIVETPTKQAEEGTPLRSGKGEEVIPPIENAKTTPEPVARPEAKPAPNAAKESRKVSSKPEPESVRSEQAVEPVGKEITVHHGTESEPNLGQKSGYYPGTYSSVDEGMAKSFGSKVFSTKVKESKIFPIKDTDALKKEALQAGFQTSSGNGKGEVEYLKSRGYEGMSRGKEVILFENKERTWDKPKSKPVNMAGETRPEKAKPAQVPQFTTIHPKSQERFNAAFESKNAEELSRLLDKTNKGMRGEFENRTGIKLPQTQKGTVEAIEKWLGETKAKDLSDAELSREILRLGETSLKLNASEVVKQRSLELAREFQQRAETKESTTTKSEPVSSKLADDFTESLNRSSEEAPVAATLKTPTRGNIAVEVIGHEGSNLVYRNEATGDMGRLNVQHVADLTPREATVKAKKPARSKKIVEERKAAESTTIKEEVAPKVEVKSEATKEVVPQKAETVEDKSPASAHVEKNLEGITAPIWTPELRQKVADYLDSQDAVKSKEIYNSLPNDTIRKRAFAMLESYDPKRAVAERIASLNASKPANWADKKIAESRGRMNLGVDPELFAAYAVKGAELVSKGFKEFKAWSNRMLSKFGQGIKNYLKDLWAVAQSQKGSIDIGGGKKPKPEPESKGPWAGKEPPENPLEQPQTDEPFQFGSYKRDVAEGREKAGMEPTPPEEKADADAWLKAGINLVKADPDAGYKLAESVIEAPRPITPAEAAVITVHMKKLNDSFTENWKIANDKNSTPEQVKEAHMRNAIIQDNLDKIHQANSIMRNEWGKMGVYLKQQLAEDYSLTAMIRKRTTEKLGEKPTGEELKKIEDQAGEIQKLQEELNKLREKRNETESAEAADNTFKELQKSVVRRKARGEKADTEDLLQKEFAHIEDKTKLPTQKQLELLARYHVENGVRNVDDLISTIKADLKKRGYDEFSDSEIRTGLSGYGSTKQLSQEEVDKALRDLKGQSRLLEQLKDAKEGIMPKLTGMLRDKPTEEQRRLMKEVNDEIAKQELSRKTPEEQRASRLDQVKTRLTNLIEELEKDIKTLENGGTINNRVRTAVERDAEANALQKRVDELRKNRDELQPKKELTEEQWNKNMTAVAKRMQAEFERRLTEKDFAVKKRPDHKASLELEQARAERDAAKKEMMEHEDYKKSAEERAINNILRRKQKQIERYEEKIANKDFEPKPRKPAPQDKRIDELDLEIRKVKNQFMMDQAAARRANRTKWQKFWDGFPEAKRAMVLSSPAVIGKLGAAGFVRNLTSGAEELVGKGLEKVIPKAVLDKATLEGKADIGALATGVKEGYSKWKQDIKDIYKVGKTDLDLKYGDKKTYDENGLGTWFGRMHYIMKAPAKRAAFRSATIRLAKKYASEGADVTSDVMQAKIATEAYKHAQNAIFMGDNVVGKMFNQAIAAAERDKGDAGAAIARTLKTLFPIVKVPLNIASESFVTAFGGLTGATKLARVYMRGIETLSEDEANMIVRHFKKGSIGAGAMLLGFLAKDSVGGFYEDKEKRKLGEIGAHKFRIFGEDVPSWLAHAPIFEVMQMGATIRRTMDKENKEGKAAGLSGIPAGLLASIVGVAEETPFMNEMFRSKELQSPEGREKFLGELLKSQVEPLLVQQIAQKLDQTPLGETVKRNPEGFVETLQSGIPFLRNKLDVKITDALPPSEIGHIPEPIKKYAMDGGIMPSKPEKGVLLHKNPNLTDEQFEKYAELRGKFVKDALLRSVSRLSRLDEDSQRNAIRTISMNASEQAKRKLRLRV